MLAFTAAATVALLLPLAVAGPFHCSLKNAVPALPANQTALAVPADQSVIAVALGVGVQNYTCNAAGAFVSAGALAELFDVSCLVNTPLLAKASAKAYKRFKAQEKLTAQDLIADFGACPPVLGQHYFITNPVTGTGIVPQFDFRAASRKGDPNAFVTAAKKAGIPAANTAQDVDWLELTSTRGALAKTIFRISTVGGQPPASCTVGATLSVKYAAQYWFYN